ncbi:MAG TPA: SUMF1/EgtB/PvdO family nonheme iron enzyme [Thermoanaerobaculia bacterium]|nr:SUMF1/EgtB/PvdO family nonheme iron enzyme [Thermoanaerobaculia bacterium]
MADRVPGGGDDAEVQEAFEYDVFLSFASANHEAADAICRTLRQGGLRVFWAPETLGDALGRDFTDAIEAGLLGSRHFVLFWTAEAKVSQWVRAEQKAFYTQCYLSANGIRRLVILPDGREPISSLPVLLRNLQVARSAEDVLKRLSRGGLTANPSAGTAITGPLSMQMRFVPAGIYKIGSPENELGRDHDETLHEVQLTHGFWLGETPVTQSQWKQRVPGRKQPSHFKAGGKSLPVESINWFEAIELANRLSDDEGLPRFYELVNPKGLFGGGDFYCERVTFAGLGCFGYRLPTEAEWEIAARAGADPTQGKTSNFRSIAWFSENAGGSTHPVGTKAPNAWGFLDLLGNVFEWTGDWHGGYSKDREVDPMGPPQGLYRVIRGGSWTSNALAGRVAYRGGGSPFSRGNYLGFRLARSQYALQPEEQRTQILTRRCWGEPE